MATPTANGLGASLNSSKTTKLLLIGFLVVFTLTNTFSSHSRVSRHAPLLGRREASFSVSEDAHEHLQQHQQQQLNAKELRT